MKQKAKYLKLFVLSFCFWFIPFCLRIALPSAYFDTNNAELERSGLVGHTTSFETLVQEIDSNNRKQVFIAIAKNNLKGCLINIAGGCILGISTVVNICFNGYFTGASIRFSWEQGLSVGRIIQLTFPHSFELIGFWLSGAIGLFIAGQIVKLARGGKTDENIIKIIGMNLIIIFLTIVTAAFVEAYITILLL